MQILPYVCLGLATLFLALGYWLDYKSRRHTGLDISEISTVCMECGRHITGPLPHRARAVSHGLCPQCAEAWKHSMLTHPFGVLPHQRN
ncbi:MAG: hypothetical protein AB9869_01145 [Verrucomicrobiia bacterium]